jgi:hypothetical protein
MASSVFNLPRFPRSVEKIDSVTNGSVIVIESGVLTTIH